MEQPYNKCKKTFYSLWPLAKFLCLSLIHNQIESNIKNKDFCYLMNRCRNACKKCNHLHVMLKVSWSFCCKHTRRMKDFSFWDTLMSVLMTILSTASCWSKTIKWKDTKIHVQNILFFREWKFKCFSLSIHFLYCLSYIGLQGTWGLWGQGRRHFEWGSY